MFKSLEAKREAPAIFTRPYKKIKELKRMPDKVENANKKEHKSITCGEASLQNNQGKPNNKTGTSSPLKSKAYMLHSRTHAHVHLSLARLSHTFHHSVKTRSAIHASIPTSKFFLQLMLDSVDTWFFKA